MGVLQFGTEQWSTPETRQGKEQVKQFWRSYWIGNNPYYHQEEEGGVGEGLSQYTGHQKEYSARGHLFGRLTNPILKAALNPPS